MRASIESPPIRRFCLSTALDFLIQSDGFQVRDAGLHIAKPLYQKRLRVDLPVDNKSKKSKQSNNQRIKGNQTAASLATST
jgi:hypothetical protein